MIAHGPIPTDPPRRRFRLLAVIWNARPLRLARVILVTYALLVLMFSLLQRSMIYFPAREAAIEPRDAGLPAGRVHAISLTTADELRLHGWHVLPDGVRAADRAACDRLLADGGYVVLYFSGNAGNRRFRIPEFDVFTRLGAHVLVFDYRGYGDNPGRPSESRLVADANQVWAYATGQRRIPANRILLYGESLGGAVAVELAASQCERGRPPAGLIVRSTFPSLVDVGRYHYPWLPVRLALKDRFHADQAIPLVTCPMLQIHGGQDWIVPVALGRQLFQAAPKQAAGGIPKRFVTIAGADHNDISISFGSEMTAAVGEFLKQLSARGDVGGDVGAAIRPPIIHQED